MNNDWYSNVYVPHYRERGGRRDGGYQNRQGGSDGRRDGDYQNRQGGPDGRRDGGQQYHGDGRDGRLIEYVNLPPIIGALVSSRIATLHELQTVYGVEDAYNLLEVVGVDNHNRGRRGDSN